MDARLAALQPLTAAERLEMRLRMAQGGISEVALAKILGTTRPTLRKLLAGETVLPPLNVHARLWLHPPVSDAEPVTAGGHRA